MERFHRCETAEETEAEVLTAVEFDSYSGNKEKIRVSAVPEDRQLHPNRYAKPASAEATSTIVEVKGTGKLTLSIALGTDNVANTQPEMLRLTLENPTHASISLAIPGCVKSEDIHMKCCGEYDFGIHNQGKQDVPTSKICHPKQGFEEHESGDSGFTKRHRRNNSDYLYVSGKSRNVVATEEVIEKTRAVDETSETFTLVHEASGNIGVDGNTCTNACDDADTRLDEMCDEFKKLGKEATGYNTSCGDDRVCLSEPIRDNFTKLLHEIRLVSLCDHLYQNYVIDMETFQAVYEANRNGRPTQECIRVLLFHLSRVPVRENKLRKSLTESDHTTIIPLLLKERD